ncbi:MAG: hypothetical protein KDC87_17855 [Planctomycetes bacterium]|nr:hypothetical protein [Planctomycetota bacterium]
MREALRDLRSGVEPDAAAAQLVESGRTAVPMLTKELTLQGSHSLFTGTVMGVLHQIESCFPKAVGGATVRALIADERPFIPPAIDSAQHGAWVIENLDRLGLQLRRLRFALDDKNLRRAENAFRVATREQALPRLADVLDGDLDGLPDDRREFVDAIGSFLDTCVGGDPELAVATARVASCFGADAGRSVPGIVALLREAATTQDEQDENDQTKQVLALLRCLERIGHASIEAIPTVLDMLTVEADSLIREDGMLLAVLDTLGGIGATTDAVRHAVTTATEHPAELIQVRARDTRWKLCLD